MEMRSFLRLIRRSHPLNWLRRFTITRAILRACDRQTWARLDSLAWPVRVRLVSHASFIVLGTPEPAVTNAFRKLAVARDVNEFWDVGANFGFYSWLFKSLNPAGRVTLIEPEPSNVSLVEQTLRRTALRDVSLIVAAASASGGTARFARDRNGGFRGSVSDSGAMITTLVALDELPGKADLIKIDVEGHEASVIEGATNVLRSHRPTVLIECTHPGVPCVRAVERLGYGSIRLDEDNYLLIPHV